MNTAKQKMLDRVKALLAKTLENGCTEGEAFAAMEKARELMATYEIDEIDLAAADHQEHGILHKDMRADPYRIRTELVNAVGRFCRCKGFRGPGDSWSYKVALAGPEADVVFATWLLDTLASFILRELKQHQAERRLAGQACPRIISSSFVHGATGRIRERLKELSPADASEVTGGNALVVSRKALIKQVLEDAGIKLKTVARRAPNVHMGALNAGRNAGDSARFDKPVSAGGALRIGRD